jgi:hypothetical protein
VSAADELHEKLFSYQPAKPGTAYERLAALVLAGLGWDDVAHDTRLRPAGRRAEHQLDVTASHPDGSVKRLLVECKDWNKPVGKGTLDALVGVRDQLNFDAARLSPPWALPAARWGLPLMAMAPSCGGWN